MHEMGERYDYNYVNNLYNSIKKHTKKRLNLFVLLMIKQIL